MPAIQQVYKWVSAINTTILHAGDGVGGTATVRIATTAGPFTFTSNSATDTNGAPWDVSTAVAGDILVTIDGYVGTFISQGATTATAIVDCWTKITTGVPGTPSGAASAVRIMRGTGAAGTSGGMLWSANKMTVLRRLVTRNNTATTNVTLYAGDQSLMVFNNSAAAGRPPDYIDLNIAVPGPVGIAASSAAVTATLYYELLP